MFRADKINSWAKREAFKVKSNPFGRYRGKKLASVEDGSESRDIPLNVSNHKVASTSSSPKTATDTGIFAQESNGINGDGSASRPENGRSTTSRTEKSNAPHKLDSSIWGQLRHSVFNSWINILLVCVPVGIAIGYIPGINPLAVFVVNFVAIIPLAGLLSYATEELALRVGETLGGLLNASFGNAVELIVAIIALKGNQIVVVQTSLIGSILSNLLLVMGMSFLFGGFYRFEQYFNTTVAQTASSILALAIGALIIPTAFSFAADTSKGQNVVTKGILKLSRGTAIILLLVYASYLFFQLKSHAKLFSQPSQKAVNRNELPSPTHSDVMNPTTAVSTAHALSVPPNVVEHDTGPEEEDREEPELLLATSVALLAGSTALVALCADALVGSIDKIVESTGISRYFVGLILLPIIGNAAEHATSVTVACRDKMDLAIGVAVGSSMQVALLIIPFIVTLGWIIGNDNMTLLFDTFQVVILFASILLVNYLIQDGKSNFLEGNLLIAMYLIIAVAAWFFPNDQKLG